MFDILQLDDIYTDPQVNAINIIFLHLFTLFSLIINGCLFYSIAKKDNATGNYRYLLLTFSAQDLLYSIAHHFTYPIAESYVNSFLFRGRGSHISTCLFLLIYGTSSPLIMGNFCYRLLLLKGNFHLVHFGRIYAAILAYALFTGVIWFSISFFAWQLDGETERVLGPLLHGSIPSPIIHTSENVENYFAGLYWSGATFEGPRWTVLASSFALCYLFMINYFVIIFCTIRIVKLLETHSMSASTLQLQRQLLRSLIGQTLFPLFTIYAASTIAMIPPMLGYHYAGIAYFIPNLCGVHPLADGLMLIITVPQYRKYLIRMFCCGSADSIAYDNSRSVRSSSTTVF